MNEARYSRAEAAVIRHSADLVRFAYSFLLNRADAQDAVQDAFESYWKHAPEFTEETQEKAWLMRVTANRCKSMLRSSWFRTRAPLSEDLPAGEEERSVLMALGRLPAKYRTAVHLHYYHGYSIKEIAALLNIPEGTVGTRLARGRELMKQELGGFEDEE